MNALAVVFALFGLLGLILLSLNAVLGPRRTNPAKETPFECGSPELQKGIRPFPIKFSLVAFLFLLLDVEAAFYFPWALILRSIKGPALAAMGIYTAFLAAGLAYAWAKGAFTWD
jgi:NADH-quinone oxidoreductase subunit A